MKKFSYLLIIIISLFFITNVKADHISKFRPSFKVEKGILNNNVAIFFGVEGESVTNTEFTFSYDNRYLEYETIELLNEFDSFNTTLVSVDGKWTTYKISVDVEYSDDYFAILYLKAKSNFSYNKSTDLFFYKYEGSNETNKYRHDGILLTLNRNNDSELVYKETIIDKSIEIKYWIMEHLLLLIGIAGGLILLLALFLLFPLFKKNKKEDIKKEDIKIENNNSLGLYNKFEGNVLVNNKEENESVTEEEIEIPKKIEAEGHETKNGMYVYNPEFDNNDKNE